jgi:hypothetical protein
MTGVSLRLLPLLTLLTLSGVPSALAEPLATQGIGVSSCARLVNDVKPTEGLNNPVNLMLFSWTQGYISAANLALLASDNQHIDMSGLDDGKMLTMIIGYCKSNPDKKPINALDEFIARSDKTKASTETSSADRK